MACRSGGEEVQPVFRVDGVDFTDYLLEGAIKWSRNDLDSEETGRTLDGIMHRTRIAIKRKLSITTRRLSQSEIESLNAALSPAFISVTFLDPIDGILTKTFYGSTVESTAMMFMDGEMYWNETTFNLIEQ